MKTMEITTIISTSGTTASLQKRIPSIALSLTFPGSRKKVIGFSQIKFVFINTQVALTLSYSCLHRSWSRSEEESLSASQRHEPTETLR